MQVLIKSRIPDAAVEKPHKSSDQIDPSSMTPAGISELFGFSRSQLAKSVGSSEDLLVQTPLAPDLQAALQPFGEIAYYLRRCGGDAGAFQTWLSSPCEDFALMKGKRPSPRDLILAGHPQLVALYVTNLRLGHPS